ncbi:hypothetical protein [Methylobacterium organophilum]|uniref:Uncharacterized protein n=1 Tax=Methylobacterium organophilum TaxID=410 RepID=A0ABQ4TFV7_METOR|nr:hypothetical protein [Methylobacterium organophilum]GJE29750.1 hypothetical protein LKMONMHP_4636 [Methylobacterium organophilum]
MTASAIKTATTSKKISASAERRRRAERTLARTARDRNVVVGRRVVPNPYNPNERMTVQVNRNVDLLAAERAAGRLDEAHYLVGRMCQAVWERQAGARLGSGGWNQGGSRDQTIAHELQIIYAIEDAAKAEAFNETVARAIGWTGVRLLKRFLIEGATFEGYAGLGASDRMVGKVAYRFRMLLEDLTEALHTATGSEGQRICAWRET